MFMLKQMNSFLRHLQVVAAVHHGPPRNLRGSFAVPNWGRADHRCSRKRAQAQHIKMSR